MFVRAFLYCLSYHLCYKNYCLIIHIVFQPFHYNIQFLFHFIVFCFITYSVIFLVNFFFKFKFKFSLFQIKPYVPPASWDVLTALGLNTNLSLNFSVFGQNPTPTSNTSKKHYCKDQFFQSYFICVL